MFLLHFVWFPGADPGFSYEVTQILRAGGRQLTNFSNFLNLYEFKKILGRKGRGLPLDPPMLSVNKCYPAPVCYNQSATT